MFVIRSNYSESSILLYLIFKETRELYSSIPSKLLKLQCTIDIFFIFEGLDNLIAFIESIYRWYMLISYLDMINPSQHIFLIFNDNILEIQLILLLNYKFIIIVQIDYDFLVFHPFLFISIWFVLKLELLIF